MRRALLGLLVLATAGVGVNTAHATSALGSTGFVVYKDSRSQAVVELRDAAGRVLSTTVELRQAAQREAACGDRHHTFFGARWQGFEPYHVNAGSIPAYLDRSAALADIVAAHSAWQTPFVTDCAGVARVSPYGAIYGGETGRRASLTDGVTTDGFNVVEFRSLEKTVCDGAFACVVYAHKSGRLTEADMLFEANLRRYGFEDFWTTDDTTWWNAVEGRYSVSDMATHEFGHFAGLGHVKSSPNLTMFPFVHDGMQTLGLGDMYGLLARYGGA
jgi:hypothetical protein